MRRIRTTPSAVGLVALSLALVASACLDFDRPQADLSQYDVGTSDVSESDADVAFGDTGAAVEDAVEETVDDATPDVVADIDEGCDPCVVPECAIAIQDPDTCQCSFEYEPVLTPCNDWNPCTVEDHCVAAGGTSVCVGNPLAAEVLCDDSDPCTTEACTIDEGCVHSPATGPACEDGDPCTGGEVCDAGVCLEATQFTCGSCSSDPTAEDTCEAQHGDGDICNGTLFCDGGVCRVKPETATECPASTDPCVSWTCEVQEGEPTCVETSAEDGTLCSDGSVCTSNDACLSGVCTGLANELPTCQCADDSECAVLDDDDLCNGSHACVDGLCLFDGASVVDCSHLESGNACIAPGCNPETGSCEAVILDSGTPCDDDDPCTINDACDSGFCATSDPLDCTELDGLCATGTCDPEVGCVSQPIAELAGEPCDVGDPCVAEAACAAGVCIPLVANDCDDGDACTVDTCTPDGGCASTPIAGAAECPQLGVCASGVPLVCDGGGLVCDLDAVPGYSEIELCDDLDNDCDGETDEECSDQVACGVGQLVKDYGGQMQACGVPAGVTWLGAGMCGDGWTVCTHSQLLARLGQESVPAGYWIAAAAEFRAESGKWSATDVHDVSCQEFQGGCGTSRSVQAVTWDGVYQGSLPYASEAWACDGDKPASDCATGLALGVMCCAPQCEAGSCPDDGDQCTVESCLATIGECQVEDVPEPDDCPDKGVCAAGVPTICTDEGTKACDLTQVAGWEAVESSCDGLDNDCDGLTDGFDEDLAAAAPACELQEGVCLGAVRGVGHCQAGAWQPCDAKDYAAVAPVGTPYEHGSEVSCDGADNDCDGDIDESFAFGGAKVGEACSGVGVCSDGVVECVAPDQPAVCSTSPGGSDFDPETALEVCNGLDDDCDGTTDEPGDLDKSAAGCLFEGVCAALVPLCDGAGWTCPVELIDTYEEAEVSCDGLDNDCDGDTDEELPWLEDPALQVSLGDPCGSEACQGHVVCSADGTGLVCNVEEGTAVEVCDGVDNDCNGLTDEGFTYAGAGVGAACDGVGECLDQQGVVECGPAGDAICSLMPGGSASAGSAELCDDLDNDCDGDVDEGMEYAGAGLGQPCDGMGECGLGEVQCSASGLPICSTDPGGVDHVEVDETCNSLDDDCDGNTDEAADLGVGNSDCKLAGVCTAQNVSATCIDGVWDCNYAGVSDYSEDGEDGLCDGKDNDCDGATDEDYFPDLGAPCDGDDADECENGEWVCVAGGDGLTCEADEAVFEQCGDGVDQDCDGDIDEPGAVGCLSFWLDEDGDGWGTGEPLCLCAADTVGHVDATQGGDCADGAAAVHPGAGETCNGIDDDCDQQIDAADNVDLLATDAQDCEDSDGVCAGVLKPVSLCSGGGWLACTSAHYEDARPAFEEQEVTCDGLDNDCDGATDEGVAATAPDCAKQAGVCQGAKTPTNLCVDGEWSPCGLDEYVAHSDEYEVDEVSCDGLDNDCDGLTDEGFTWGGGVVGATCDGVGACGAGVVECLASGEGATCSTNPNGSGPGVPDGTVEACNDIDDDCDGQTDESVPAADSPCFFTGVCTPGNVIATCTGGAWLCDYSGVEGYESPTEASCDGLDNDCDGATDDDFNWLDDDGELKKKGQTCGAASCEGVVVCDDGGQGVTCSSTGDTGIEICNHADDDCDGQTDEGLTYSDPVTGSPVEVGDECNGYGECGAGIVECAADGSVVCSSLAQAGDEVCNGLDDDCDGATDEGFTYLGDPVGDDCDGVGACGAGTVECTGDGTAATCSTNPNGSAYVFVAEACDLQDNDCDGVIDEEMGWAESDCKKTGVCTSANTVAVCNAGQWQCDYNSPRYDPADDESGDCDEFDNDCDGTTDDAWPDKGMPCDNEDDADLCEYGTWQCPGNTVEIFPVGGMPPDQSTGLVCEADEPQFEYCGGNDNDCDGVIDEDGSVGCVTWYLDQDNDGYGDPDNSVCRCAGQDLGQYTSSNDDDCQPTFHDAHPGADEYCDDWDRDCDGSLTAGAVDCQDRWLDEDGDQYGTGEPQCLCEPEGFFTALQGGDCNDINGAVNPGASEKCDDFDHDCDGHFFVEGTAGCFDYFFDGDGDGFGPDPNDVKCYCEPTGNYTAQAKGDCCDSDPGSFPGNLGWKTTTNACGDWDWDCSGDVDLKWPDVGECWCSDGTLLACDECGQEKGWAGDVEWWTNGGMTGTVAECGETGDWLKGCEPEDYPIGVGSVACQSITQDRTQECR